MLTYEPIINYIEEKEAADEDHDLTEEHPLVLQMLQEIKIRFGNEVDPCVGGASNL